jgi:hypothetical protein
MSFKSKGLIDNALNKNVQMLYNENWVWWD